MGQRHQLFVIAKVGNRYRSLAVIHHQWLYDITAIRHCLVLLRIFSAQANRPILRQELAMADSFFANKDDSASQSPQNDSSFEQPVPFPFISTCLLIGSGYDVFNGTISAVHEEPFDMGYDQGDNNDGITILDITDLENVRYCFVNFMDYEEDINLVDLLHRPLSGRQYLKFYDQPSRRMNLNNTLMVDRLDENPLVDVRALADAWPWGPWKLGEASALPPVTPDRDVPLKGPSGLMEQSLDKLIEAVLSSGDFNFDLIDNSIQSIPHFQERLRQCLTNKYPDRVGSSSTSAPLLKLAYAEQEVVDWSCFSNLNISCIKAALEGEELKSISTLNISGTLAVRSPGLVDALSILSSLDTLYALDSPDRKDDAASTRIYSDLSRSHPHLIKEKIVLSGPFSHGIRQELWFPDDISSLPAFPVVQMLVFHELDVAGKFDGFTPLESFFLGDALLTPARAVTGLFRYLECLNDAVFSRYQGTALRVANCFATSTSSVGIYNDIEIGPLAAEAYAIGKASYHSSTAAGCYSLLRDLVPGQWSIFVWASPSTSSVNKATSPDVCFKYAFARSKVHLSAAEASEGNQTPKIEDLEVVDAREFLRRTSPGVETHTLEDHTDSITRLISNDDDVARLRSRILKCMEVEEVFQLLERFVKEVPKVKKIHERLRFVIDWDKARKAEKELVSSLST